MPWTAPIYDQRPTVTDPQLYCISSMEGLDGQGNHAEASCRCMTEQGTLYELSQPECRTLARNGPVYNPYRQRRDFAQIGRTAVQADPSAAAGRPADPVPAGSVIGNPAKPIERYGP